MTASSDVAQAKANLRSLWIERLPSASLLDPLMRLSRQTNLIT